jgi:hypothetical protein
MLQSPQPSSPRMRGSAMSIAEGGDAARIVEQARELVGVLRGLAEWDHGPGLDAADPDGGAQRLPGGVDLLAGAAGAVQKSVRDQWLQAMHGDLAEIRARLGEV